MPVKEFLKRLGYDELLKQERPLLGEDYIFDPTQIAAAKEFKAIHENVFLEESSIALVRQIHLQHASKPHSSLHVTLTLCWNGFQDALTALTRFAGSFERGVPAESVVSTVRTYEVGDFGVAWAWSGKGDPDILAVVRSNVFLGIRSHDAGEVTVSLARAVDTALRNRKATEAYSDTSSGLFAELKKRGGETLKVPSTGKLLLGTLPEGDAKFFFLTSSGSVNRDADKPETWYYRAGTKTGPQVIRLYWVDAGILPKRDALIVEVY
jgi:hypothetical protein